MRNLNDECSECHNRFRPFSSCMEICDYPKLILDAYESVRNDLDEDKKTIFAEVDKCLQKKNP